MTTQTQTASLTAIQQVELPVKLQRFQDLMKQPEVQSQMVRIWRQIAEIDPILAELGGFSMIHKHDDTHRSGFTELPNDEMQIEFGGKVSFLKEGDNLAKNSIPVAWRFDCIPDAKHGHISYDAIRINSYKECESDYQGNHVPLGAPPKIVAGCYPWSHCVPWIDGSHAGQDGHDYGRDIKAKQYCIPDLQNGHTSYDDDDLKVVTAGACVPYSHCCQDETGSHVGYMMHDISISSRSEHKNNFIPSGAPKIVAGCYPWSHCIPCDNGAHGIFDGHE
jgi:hypothetical protein